MKKTFPKVGNEKGMKKSIPKFREREGNEKNPFPKFGNGNQRPPFLSMTGNGNSRSPLTPFDDFGQKLISCPKTQFFLVVCCLSTGLRVASSFPPLTVEMNPLYLHHHTKFWILHCNHAEKSLFRNNWLDDVEEALGD